MKDEGGEIMSEANKMPFLKGKKRTEQIDDEREEVIGVNEEGKTVFIKAGSKKLTGDEKGELKENLDEIRLRGEVEKFLKVVVQAQQIAIEKLLEGIVPNCVIEESLREESALNEWLRSQRLEVVIADKDDPWMCVLVKDGKEIASARFPL